MSNKPASAHTPAADDLTREERLYFLRHTYDGVDEQVRFANHKASYILATVGCVFVGCGAALLGPELKSELAKVLLAVGLVLSSASGAAACITVFPVLRKRDAKAPGRSLMFFGAISKMSVDDYAAAVEGLNEREIYDEMCQAIHALSCVAQEKYGWIRISTLILALSLIFVFASFVAIFLR